MEILNLSLPTSNKFISDYIAQSPEINRFFHYQYNDTNEYDRRLKDIQSRTFFRRELADYIKSYMKKFPSSNEVDQSIEKLKMKDSVVVIGGQQAGILTGPLYTIHKLISIITFAKQKEKELGVPVVPVFWIAGEDHDFQEVNHVYVPEKNKPLKKTYRTRVLEKKMVSDIGLDQEACRKWVNEIIQTLGETDHTNQLKDFIHFSISKSQTFVDFFANMIMYLFKDYGILLIDSGDKGLRSLEKEIFIKQISQYRKITSAVLTQQAELSKAGMKNTIDINEASANLFYYDEKINERILLQFEQETGMFIGKNKEVSFSEEELQAIATEYPEKLSNNVVTRPITQEMLFPSLAFIAGPGEIAYWAELKQAFELFDMKMPPIVPRMNITLLERPIERDLAELKLELKNVLVSGTGGHELKFIDSVMDKELDALFEELKKEIISKYKVIEEKTQTLDKGLVPLVKKNESMLLQQLQFMESKVYQSVCNQNDVILNKFTKIETSLRPNGSPQERVWNLLYFLNSYGLDFIKKIMGLSFVFDGTHKIIKL